MSQVAEQVAEAAVHQHKDYTGAKVGMWLFLFTEVLLFGGLFVLYSVYRGFHIEEFHQGSQKLNLFFGVVNTVILLTSSLTMALSIACFQKGKKSLSILFLVITIFFGLGFMANKYVEWSAKIHHGIYPNSPAFNAIDPQTKAPYYSRGEVTFFNLYFLMTGLHGFHVLAGMGIMSVMVFIMLKRPNRKQTFQPFKAPEALEGAKIVLQSKGGKTLWESEPVDDTVKHLKVELQYFGTPKRIGPNDYVALENVGLYWHLVDLIWIFLFPLFYLIT